MKKLKGIKSLMVVIFLIVGFANVIKAEEAAARQNSTNDDYHTDNPNKDILYYPMMEKKDVLKPNVKFYSNKEFKGNPTAIVNEDGFFVHDKKKCEWHKDFKKAIEYKLMYPAGKPEEECIGYGLVYTWIDSMEGGKPCLTHA